jgi:hypothetical protein
MKLVKWDSVILEFVKRSCGRPQIDWDRNGHPQGAEYGEEGLA